MRPVALALAFTLSAAAAEIPAGTHVLLRMQNSVTTRTAKEGDRVYLQTASPVSVEDSIVIPVGSHVQGVVTYARRPGKVKGRAELGIRLESLILPGGRTLKLQPRVAAVESDANGQFVSEEDRVKQAPNTGKDAGQVAIYAGSGAALGAMIGRIGDGSALRGAGVGAGAGAAVGLVQTLLTRGNEVELRQGSTVDVVFDRPVTLE
jgi:type IV secretion system protein VirB10